jgi:hypothetical protein
VVIALAVLFTATLIDIFLSTGLPFLLTGRGIDINQIGTVLGAVGLVKTGVDVIVWALLLAAVFGWRKAPEVGGISS